MNYRNLGNTGLKISEISLGTWITFAEQIPEKKAKQIFEQALDLGINYFDTANSYAGGKAEELLGRFARSVPRDRLVIATKAYYPGGVRPTQRGLSRKHLVEACEGSLKRLGLSHIDIYHCHYPDKETPLDETAAAMDSLVRSGKILYWGTSNFNATQISQVWNLARERKFELPVTNQPPYNLLDRNIEKEIIPLGIKKGIGQVVYSPLKMGVLTGKYDNIEPETRREVKSWKDQDWFKACFSRENIDKAAKFKELATECGVRPSQLALSWCLREKAVSSVICGVSRPKQLTENIKASGMAIPQEVMTKAEKIFQK